MDSSHNSTEKSTGGGELKRTMGLLDATMIVAGIMIGSGIFIVSADVARQVGSGGWLMISWIIAGVITLIGALSYGELAGMYPQAGGQYVYLREMYNPLVAFLYGWTFFMVIQCGSIAAVGVAFGKFLGVLEPSLGDDHILTQIAITASYTWQLKASQLVAISLIVLLTWVNTRGVKTGKTIQNVFTFAKLASLFGLIVFGLTMAYNSEVVSVNLEHFWEARSFSIDPQGIPQLVTLSGMGIIIALAISQTGTLFSSDGWNNITFAAGEVVNPKRNVPLSLALGTGIVTVLYLLANVAYIVALPVIGGPGTEGPINQGIAFAANDRVGSNVAEMILPGMGAGVMAVLIMVSTFGCNNGMILAGARCYYAMAKDKLFFRNNGELNKSGAPANALWFQCLWACVLCLSGRYNELLDFVIFGVLIFYILTIAGIFIMRRRAPKMERPIKAFGYPVLPALYIIVAGFICYALLTNEQKSTQSLIGLAIILAGIPIYYLVVGKRSSGEE